MVTTAIWKRGCDSNKFLINISSGFANIKIADKDLQPLGLGLRISRLGFILKYSKLRASVHIV